MVGKVGAPPVYLLSTHHAPDVSPLCLLVISAKRAPSIEPQHTENVDLCRHLVDVACSKPPKYPHMVMPKKNFHNALVCWLGIARIF